MLHLALSPCGTTVASAAADETLRFWKVFQDYNKGGLSGGLGLKDKGFSGDRKGMLVNPFQTASSLNLR